METTDVLAALGETEIEEETVEEGLDSILAGFEAAEEEFPAEPQIEAVLSSLPLGDPTPEAVASSNEIDAALNELALGADDLGPDKSEEESARILADLEMETQAPNADPIGELDQVLENLGEEAPAAQEIDVEAAFDDILSDLAEVPDDQDADDSLDDILDDLGAIGDADEEPADAALDDILAGLDAGSVEESEATEQDSAEAILAGLESQEAPPSEEGGLGDALNELSEKETPERESSEDLELADLLGDLAGDAEEAGSLEAASDDLDDILADLGDSAASVEEDATAGEAKENLEDVLAALEGSAEPLEQEDGLSDILNDLSEGENKVDELFEEDPELSDLLGDLTAAVETESATDDTLGELDDILSSLGDEEAGPNSDGVVGEATAEEPIAAVADDEHDELDALLSDLEAGESADDDLSSLLGKTDVTEGASDLDNLLADLGIDETGASASDAVDETGPSLETEFAYGTISADRPEPQKLIRKRFRIALLGDFSGRAARGLVEAGGELATRPEIQLDPDTVEEVIEGFKTELRLPIGKEGAAISVKLGELDDLHPDELFDNVDLFSELVALRRQLDSGVTVEHATRTLRSWAEAHATPARAPKLRSAGNSVPADRRLSDFQHLIGDQTNALGEVSPVEEMLARIVGPHIRALPDPNLTSLQAAVDEALSDAMRLVLHHPEFQSVEAQWRSLDLIARSVEVGDDLEVILYDVSAEEIAVDLASQDDLAETGLVRLLTEKPLDPDLGRGGYSAIIGLFNFEETPPHAELLGRIARVAAHVDAPFFASISPGFLDLPKQDRPILTAKAWDTLKSMPEAGHLGLASPRFLLRRPYGSKTDPIDAFKFEEFSETEGLRGMLWANPVVLLTILLAQSFRQNGDSLQLGSIMSLGGMPYHYVTDRHGDQVALPCTERNIDLDKIAAANDRGFMAISAVKGRDELRLTSFQSVAGGEILGPWTGVPAPEPSPPDPREASGPASMKASDDIVGDQESDEFDLGDLELDGKDAETNELGDLDDLLASFEDDSDDAAEDGDMDAELAALLSDL
ncbi:type VI secretion system contractile sheath domain-containing protein [Roseobacter sp. SK209-2-6]|uniref:type VI secretion system contractile sheath domain-containing protein n=1 Tax=Roseobacter sp. SK209-2-6 TaxID=388739 RepID=UPI003FA4C488